MNTITVNASSCYNIHIGSGILKNIGSEIRKICQSEKICIVSESNVFPLYGSIVADSLRTSGFSVITYIFEAGEEQKNTFTYISLLNFLAENKLTRSDLIVALGGGVTGDLAGFAAATYLRGIPFVQVPTTLLAAVDSSVGGKTAIDLPSGKNLAGAFYQPRLVLFDIDVLNSLPLDTFTDGCAEIIKYAILYDPELFAHLETSGLHFDRERVVSRCVELKRDVVVEDEFDTGVRKKLNLGHTIGHGVEARSSFLLSHGKSVAIGTAIVTRAAVENNLCDINTCKRILTLLKKFNLPISTEYPVDDIYHYTLSDKKRSGKRIDLIVPVEIGNCAIVPTSIEDLKSFILAGL